MPDEATIRDEINQTDKPAVSTTGVTNLPDPIQGNASTPMPDRANAAIAAGPGDAGKPFATEKAELTVATANAVVKTKSMAHELLVHLDSLGDHAALATAKQKLQEVVFWATHGVVTAPPKS